MEIIMANLKICRNKFYMGDEEFRLYGGTIHYFRVHPSEWEDRLQKLKDSGLNTVETYIAWNVHSRHEDEFFIDETNDFVKFIEIAEKLGLYVIVRPGPYICAEWEMGGLPSWLLNVRDIKFRQYNEPYLKYTRIYLQKVIELVKPHFTTNGGRVIAMQIENEFGGFGRPDKKYLSWLRDTYAELGVDVLTFTSDGTWAHCLEDGAIDGVLMTANFGSKASEAFARLDALRPGEPKVCMEFWNGWFDQWGTEHHTREPKTIIDELKNIIDAGGYFNMYMFCGGTNFGFMNGSNCNPRFEPCVTSYDYGAPLAEDGRVTEQYHMLKELLTGDGKYEDKTVLKSYGEVSGFSGTDLFENKELFGKTYKDSGIKTMEDLGQSFGYILYEADIDGMEGEIEFGEPHDRAMFYADGNYIGCYERGREYEKITIGGAHRLQIFIENMGRVNYGQRIFDKKGLLENVKIGGGEIEKFDISTYPFDAPPAEVKNDGGKNPTLYTAKFTVDEVGGTHILPTGFNMGIIFINGFNLGRYRSIGPQQSLYVPSGILKTGENTISVLDLYPTGTPKAEFSDKPELDVLKEEI